MRWRLDTHPFWGGELSSGKGGVADGSLSRGGPTSDLGAQVPRATSARATVRACTFALAASDRDLCIHPSILALIHGDGWMDSTHRDPCISPRHSDLGAYSALGHALALLPDAGTIRELRWHTTAGYWHTAQDVGTLQRDAGTLQGDSAMIARSALF